MEELLELIDDSDREYNPEWLQDELFAIKRLRLQDKFLNMHRSENKFSNDTQSTVAWVIGVTDTEPTNYPEGLVVDYGREDMPDIDTDIEDQRRAEVIQDMTDAFTHVAGISTISFFQGKSSIRDAARVLGVPLPDVNRALKDNDASLLMNESEEYYDWFIRTAKGKAFNKKYPEVVVLARRLHGRIRQVGQHASGFVVSKEPLEDVVPIQSGSAGNDGVRKRIVGLTMDEVEKVGLIKMDMLGLKALSVIADTRRMVQARAGYVIDLINLPLDDVMIYNNLSRGYTKGLFQVEQPAYTGLILDMGGVSNFDELVASNALVRPGAMKTIGPSYIARKNGREVTEYIHPKTEYFTKNTYGLATLFQEHQMLLCVELGGMNMGEANKVRRGLGKKQIDKILPFKEKFIENAKEYVGRSKAEKLWADLELGAEYNFNLSHSVAYSMLTYWTAWLKHYYPVEFMTATIRNETESDSVTDYLIEAKRLGIKIKLPHINNSGVFAEPEGRDAIRMGLSNIAYCGEKAARRIILSRPYKDYAEFMEVATATGSGINKRVRDNINKIGAARFEDNPLRGDEKENLYEVLKIPAFTSMALDPIVEHRLSQTDVYDEEGVHVMRGLVRSVTRKDGWARIDILDEVGNVNVFINPESKIESGKNYLFLIAANSVIRAVPLEEVHEEGTSVFMDYLFGKLPELQEDEYISIAFRGRKTKAGKDMATVVAVDSVGGTHAVLVWPSDYEDAKGRLFPGRVWKGMIKEKEDEDNGRVTKFFAPPKSRYDFRNNRGSD